LGGNLDWTLVPQTRVHAWWNDGAHSQMIFLKREDTSQYGMTAGKQRKFASILPKLIHCKKVAVIGGANSNHVVAAAMLLREKGIEVVPFLKKTHAAGTNPFLLSLMVDPIGWRWIDHDQWPEVEKVAEEFVAECESKGIKADFIPEGGSMKWAIEGAMTLAADIQRNAQESELTFSDIFIDAGTGLSASALVMGLYEQNLAPNVHVTLMADSEDVFLQKFKKYCGWYEEVLGRQLPDLTHRLVLHRPAIAPSFGSVNAEVLAAVKRYAQRGILCDPIYSAKHFVAVDKYLDEMAGKRTIQGLIIHSGGAQALPGFEGRLNRGN
jgi:1-aminocyclopropane-1-carboxylate deaminase